MTYRLETGKSLFSEKFFFPIFLDFQSFFNIDHDNCEGGCPPYYILIHPAGVNGTGEKTLTGVFDAREAYITCILQSKYLQALSTSLKTLLMSNFSPL